MRKDDVSLLDESEVVTNADIERYETMPLDQVNRELRSHGIDPSKTIAEVERLVEERMRGTTKRAS